MYLCMFVGFTNLYNCRATDLMEQHVTHASQEEELDNHSD